MAQEIEHYQPRNPCVFLPIRTPHISPKGGNYPDFQHQIFFSVFELISMESHYIFCFLSSFAQQ